MNVSTIKRIQKMYQQTRLHSDVREAFSINDAECYAINSLGLRKGMSAQKLALHMDKIKAKMTIGEVAEAEDALKRSGLRIS